MIIEPLSWKMLVEEMTVTFALIILMIGLFLGFNLGLLPAFISRPGVIDISTWGAHFFHISPMHLISNLLIALLTGALLERAIGRAKYALITGLILTFLVAMLASFNPDPLLGFSGIGMGLMTFALVYDWHNIHNRQLLLVLIGLNLVFGFFPGVSWHGHFFGSLAGFMAFCSFQFTGLLRS